MFFPEICVLFWRTFRILLTLFNIYFINSCFVWKVLFIRTLLCLIICCLHLRMISAWEVRLYMIPWFNWITRYVASQKSLIIHFFEWLFEASGTILVALNINGVRDHICECVILLSVIKYKICHNFCFILYKIFLNSVSPCICYLWNRKYIIYVCLVLSQ